MKARILIMRSRTEGNAPLPFVEFRTPFSHGYNGTDIFSPEMDYCLGPAELPPYLARVNALLAKKGCAPITVAQLTGQLNQLKAFVDVCHLYGLAVLPDVVYNHAGGELDDQSLDFFNRPANPGEANSIYFSTGREAGGKVFNYREPDVREFLIGNARMFLDEYHVDGFRFDQVTVIDNNGGWYFCQNLTDTLRYHKPSAALIAEYWGEHRWKAVAPPVENAGMGFDLGYANGLRDSVREVLWQAAGGADANVDIGLLRAGLDRPANLWQAWRVYNCIENHDLVLDLDGDHRYPRIPNGPIGTTHGPGWPAAAPGWRPAFCSPPPACRCCSWAKNSWKTSGGPMTPTGETGSSGGRG
jgi:1,4-alpha-glucan branching enzyme